MPKEKPKVNIGEVIRSYRSDRGLSQGDIERRTGLLRCYLSRVENGHTVPAVETLEKFARALEIPMYQLLYEGEDPPADPNQGKRKGKSTEWGSSGKDAHLLAKFRRVLGRLDESDRRMLLFIAQKMSRGKTT